MKSLCLILLLAFVLCTIETATAQFGFGCPFNQIGCHKHCQSIRYRGGRCGNFLKRTCICYGNRG
uniref:Defensin n=1 Tax=Hadrurus spadix TaxID=141984 RepID=A0A1W7RAN7_9SCOR